MKTSTTDLLMQGVENLGHERLRQELREALERQAATGEILRVISTSPTDAQPVFDTIAESAARLCKAQFCFVFRFDGSLLHFMAQNGLTPDQAGETRRAYPIVAGHGTAAGRAVLSGAVVQIPDMGADPDYGRKALVESLNLRSVVAVPMLREGLAVGVIALDRTEAGHFPEQQIELLRTFADQAVIAIENARLFDEVRARNRELSEALDQQTATSQILGVIASSPGDVRPVLATIAENAARLCEAFDAIVRLKEGSVLVFGAHYGPIPVDPKAWAISRKWTGGRSVVDCATIHVHDLAAAADEFPEGWAMAQRIGHRTTLAVPLLRESEAIGTMMIRRMEVKPFSEAQISLLRTFADQAVIAIENARLFDEVQTRNREMAEALEQQVATSAILRAIAASPTDIQPVLDAVTENAGRLCEAFDTTIFLRRGDVLVVAAHQGAIPMVFDRLPLTRDLVTSRAVIDRVPVHVHDLTLAGDEFPEGQTLAVQMGFRTILGTPLLREGEAIGALMIRRAEARPFSDRQINLLKTFADQAVIAIENVRLFEEVQDRNRALTESLEQQVATGTILQAIAASPTDIQPVLNAVAESAARLCGARDANIMLPRGDALYVVAHHGAIPIDYTELPIVREMVAGRVMLDRKPVHVHDMAAEGEFPLSRTIARRLGARTLLAVPLLREDEAIGVLMIRRDEVRPFSDKQIDLLRTFADQSVIAIENVRLFEEVQARTAELSEALQQQTATADVLKVISRSAFDLQAVLDTLAESAARLCEADIVDFYRLADEGFEWAASFGEAETRRDHTTIVREPGRGSASGRVLLERKTVHIPDFEADAEFTFVDVARKRGIRAILGVPLMRGDALVGLLLVMRKAPGAFAAKQIDLAETFADQAVIAIENARLFEEVQARNRDLTESLERQTAMSDILRVISRSPTDVQPVFETIAESAARLCSARYASVFRFDGELIHFAAQHGLTPEGVEAQRRAFPMRPGRGSGASRAILSAAVEQIPDVDIDPDYQIGETARAVSARSVLAVPILRDGRPVGSINLGRPEPGAFPSRQIELLQTFADQAVIAIENVRLFDEVQARTRELTESLERQTAASEILRVIARSPTDVQPVFDTIATSVAQLCAARYCIVFGFDGTLVHFVAEHGLPPEAIAGNQQVYPMPPGRGSAAARAILSRTVEQIPDVETDPDFVHASITRRAGVRSLIAVPMLKDDVPAGAIVVARPQTGLFPERQIDLLKTFADQAVIAIENVRLFEEVQARTAEVTEALQQQTATADVLKVISRSAFDLDAVLQTLVDSAIRLCGADKGAITLREGNDLRFRAGAGQSPELRAYEQANPHRLGHGTFQGRAAIEGTTIHVPDVLADPEYERKETAALGIRAVLAVPLKRGAEVIGVFGLARATVGPFAPRQIELVESFADQAVIAIENARLFEEVQAKTRDLEESLTFQKATSGVLEVIGRSASNLQPVFDVILDTAADLCHADMSVLRLMRDGALLHVADSRRNDPAVVQHSRENPILPTDRSSVAGRVALARHTVHIPDLAKDEELTFLRPVDSPIGSLLGVPLIQDGNVAGVIVLLRRVAQPFTQRQIELVETFADQAVIAIENVRLFEEVQARTAELSEALQQQTATADVLKVISRSAFDLQPVLDALATTAVRVCEADRGAILRPQGEVFTFAANAGFSQELVDYATTNPLRASQGGSAAARAAATRKTVHLPDVLADSTYTVSEFQKLGDYRTMLAVPLLREGAPIGVFILSRTEVKPFTEKQIELVETFADQAVIAIENARLFDEVQTRTAELSEALQQQTATADVLKVISRSAFDLQSVLQTLIESAAALCEANTAGIYMQDKDVYRLSASVGATPEFVAFENAHPCRVGRESFVGRTALEKAVIHVADASADKEHTLPESQKIGGYRAVLCVPLMREGSVIGVFALSRREADLFTPRQIELVESFADQAVIAIENVRLFDEVRARTRELGRSLEELRTAQDRLVQTEKLASLGQLTAGIAHEIKNPLNFVNNFSSLSGEMIDELREALAGAPIDEKLRAEIADLTEMLKSNLEKVVQHGRRADSIVKNMLLHSRAGSGEHRPSDINAIVEESLNLAYHGARAEKQGFNITMEKSLDPAAGEVDLFPQEITRVLLNLISNGFYAATKRKAVAESGYEPTLTAATKNLGESVEIRIRDNGIGIPPEVKEQMFNPFFTTKPAGEGTGLGLSLSHDIIVKQHAGTIEVETEPGAFTEFRIVLPRGAASLGKSGGNA